MRLPWNKGSKKPGRNFIWQVAGAAAIVFCAVFFQASRVDQPAAQVAVPEKPGEVPLSVSAGPPVANDGGASVSSSGGPAKAGIALATDRTVTAVDVGGGEAATENASEDQEVESGAEPAAGRPFPASASVNRTCQEGQACAHLKEELRLFAAEERSGRWARNLERRLAAFVDESKRGEFKIRNVECRTTRCVMEVEAAEQPLYLYVEDEPYLKDHLYSGIGDLGFEKGPGGETIFVTLLTYKRQ